MPRPGPKPEDLDFDIHVDPSCLSDTMADDEVPTKVVEEEKKDEVKPETVAEDAKKEDTPDEKAEEPEAKKEDSDLEAAAEAITKEPEDKEGEAAVETTTKESEDEDDVASPEAASENSTEPPAEKEPEAKVDAPEPAAEPTKAAEPETADTTTDDDKPRPTESAEPTDKSEPEPDAKSEKDPAGEDPEELAVEDEAKPAEPEPTPEPEKDTEEAKAPEPEREITPNELAEKVEETLAMAAETGDLPDPAPAVVVDEAKDDDDEPPEVREASRSSSSLRRASGHTEALIQAAAKEVLERLEAQTMENIRNRPHSPRDSMDSAKNGTEIHYDVTSDSTRRESFASQSQASHRGSRRESCRDSRRESRRENRRESDALPTPMHTEDGGDSSSQYGADSDVFSERSHRSSLGSFDGNVDHHKDTEYRSKRSSRMSDVSMSDISHYDREEFVPTIRASQRMPFRTTSDVRAMQYSSPAASVIGSPRSNKRQAMPTISRLGSPTVSAQYSPKGRVTPTRFKAKKEPPPLVLLHVTLLPLRWQWAQVLEAASSDTLSAEAKTLREAWHHLHDRVAETVCERGILLSHPQEDYEVLEERLLEALDLPLRRRARVLECGHYVGPSNESTLTEDIDSDEDEYDEEIRRRNALAKTHWCPTCRHDIRYENLGPGKIFRIKVYASNGLMRTGAWAACWKEMERVDVEIEPIVTSGVLDELERLAISQSQQLELVKHDPTILDSTEDRDRDLHDDHDMSAYHRETSDHLDRELPALEEPPQEGPPLEESNMIEPKYIEEDPHIEASPPPADEHRSPSPEPMSHRDESEERRLRDEARLREIYGHTPPPAEPQHEPVPEPEEHPEPRAQTPTPTEPQEQSHQQHYQHEQHHHQQHQQQPDEAFAREQERQRAFQNAGLAELLLEAARVFMQDKKNLAIVVMGFLVLFMAVKPTQREVKEWDGKFVERTVPEVSEVAAEATVMETVESMIESITSLETPVQVVVEPTPEVEVPEPSQEVEVSEPSQETEIPEAIEEAEVSEVSESTQESEVPEPSLEIPVSEPTALVAEPSESSSLPETLQTTAVEESSALPETEQTTAIEEEPTSTPEPTSSALEEEETTTPTPSQSQDTPTWVAVHQTITTREVIRIIETVTETVKAIVTETEVVKAQASPSVAPEALAEDQVEDQVDGQVEDQVENSVEDGVKDEVEDQVEDEAEDQVDKTADESATEVAAEGIETEEALSAETTLSIDEPVDEAVAEDDEAVEETVEQEESETADHDEL